VGVPAQLTECDVALLGLQRDLCREAEWVTSGIEEDSPSIKYWLNRCNLGPQALSLRYRALKIRYREIEMDLLGNFALRPRRGNVA